MFWSEGSRKEGMSKPGNTHLTRYMSFDRFVDLCANGLFISNVSLFKDIWEGLLGVISVFGINQIQKQKEAVKIAKNSFFVSCWHKNSEENMAMWKQYGRKKASVCVKTTISRLINCCFDYCKIQQSHNIMLSEIQYVSPYPNDLNGKKPLILWDYWDSANMNPKCQYNLVSIKTLQGLMFKHKTYSYEKEIRLICDTFTGSGKPFPINQTKGIRISLHKGFFQKVVLSPGTSLGMLEKVKSVLRKHGYDKTIIKMSALNFIPTIN